ncbi:MAG: hypothetical protein HY606_12600 [Planctomycetes bacterium]|nr:hypothetical protein [Planctomycetota bacterium]
MPDRDSIKLFNYCSESLKLGSVVVTSINDLTAKSFNKIIYRLINLYFLCKSNNEMKATLILCKAGLPEQSLIQARSIFEMFITLAYICLKHSTRSKLFVNYCYVHKWIEKEMFKKYHKELRISINTKKFQNHSKTIDKNYLEVSRLYPDRFTWAGKRISLKKMAEDVARRRKKSKFNIVMWYEVLYDVMSVTAHNKPTSMLDYIDLIDPNDMKKGFQINKTPMKEQYYRYGLGAALISHLSILHHACDIFNLKAQKKAVKRLLTIASKAK